MEMGKGDVESYCLFFICFVSCRLWRMAILSCSYKAWVNIGNLVEEHVIVLIKLPKVNLCEESFKFFPYMEIKTIMCVGRNK
jgi:hypothetical protein